MGKGSGHVGALDGIRVIDATQMLAGPLATLRMGDLGADVIKLESPGSGEFNRTHGLNDRRFGGEMTTFLSLNRNKRSLALDAKDPAAREALYELVRASDVFIQNFRIGAAQRLGLDHETLLEINPRLVYCSISGYGSDGPYRDRPGQDLLIQGYSGSMWSVGKRGEPPVAGAIFAADAMTGYQAVIAILAALQSRERTGVGQHVEIDMLSVILDAQLQELVTFLNTGEQPTRTEESSAHASLPAPYGVYRTADGWITVAMSELPTLGRMLEDDWLARFTSYNDGHDHRDEVLRHLQDSFLGKPTAEWLRIADETGVWAGPVYDYRDLERDPHVRARGLIVEQPHRDGTTVRTIASPIRMSGTPTAITRGAPVLGGDSVDILRSVGVDDSVIAGLVSSGAVRDETSTRV